MRISSSSIPVVKVIQTGRMSIPCDKLVVKTAYPARSNTTEGQGKQRIYLCRPGSDHHVKTVNPNPQAASACRPALYSSETSCSSNYGYGETGGALLSNLSQMKFCRSNCVEEDDDDDDVYSELGRYGDGSRSPRRPSNATIPFVWEEVPGKPKSVPPSASQSASVAVDYRRNHTSE